MNQNAYTLARRLRLTIHWIFRRLHIPHHYFLVLVSAILGYLTAFGALVFSSGIEYLEEVSFYLLDHLPSVWLFPLVPAFGGLSCAIVIHIFAREAKGNGVPEVIFSVLVRNGIIRMRVAFAKLVATVLCLGTLGSAGREGPIVQIGAALGSGLGQMLALKAESIKVLVGCGAAAGIAATFNAPIGGVIFALEVLLHSFSPATFIPVVVASVISAISFHSLAGSHYTFTVNFGYQENFFELFTFALLGVFTGIFAVLFSRLLYLMDKKFSGISWPLWFKAFTGGLIVGVMIIHFRDLGGSGYSLVQSLLDGNHRQYTVSLLFLFLILKMLATSTTLASGGSGGIFAPSLIMGGICGGFLHGLLSPLLPVSAVGVYVVVGMASFVAGATHGPIAAILVLCEMSHNYELMLPLMAGCITATMVARSISKLSIYTMSLKDRGIYLKDGHDLDVLKTFHVHDIMETKVCEVESGSLLSDSLPKIQASTYAHVLVRDQNAQVLGVLSLSEVISYVIDCKKGLSCRIHEIVHQSDDFVYDTDPILLAYEWFLTKESQYLLVKNKKNQFVGILFKNDLIRSYKKALTHKSLSLQ